MLTMGGAAMLSKGRVEAMAAAETEDGAEAVTAAVTCVLLVLCCLLGARYLRQRHRYWQRRGVPCPPAPPLVGHTLARMGLTRPFTEFFDELYYNYNGRDYCGFYDFLKPGLFVGNPQLVKAILVQDFQYFADRRTFDLSKVSPVANDMLTNARGTHWRRIRSAVSPAFTKNRTRRLYPLLLERASHFLRLIRSVQQDQQEPLLTTTPTSTTREPIASKPVRETAIDTAEPGLGSKDKVCVGKSKENTERGSRYSKKTDAEEEAKESTVRNEESNVITLQGTTQQTPVVARTTAVTATTTAAAATRAIQNNHRNNRANSKHKQIDSPKLPPPNEELTSTPPASDTGDTHLATPPPPPHDTNNNSSSSSSNSNNNSARRSTATGVYMEVQADTQTHQRETNTAATTPRRRNTATATDDDPGTKSRGGGDAATCEELKRKDDIEARRVCGRYTMDAIASCAFGLECEALDKEAALFPIMAARVFQLSPTRALKMLLVAVSPRAAELASAAGLRYTSEEFTFFLRVAKHALATRRATHTPRGDFLDLLLEAAGNSKQGLSDDTLAAQAILFLLAGYDNTANTLAMSLHLLAHHPAARARLRRELGRAILRSGSNGSGRLNYEEVTELPYLDAVVCETLRLYPAAPVIERVCTESCRLGGVEVEAGTGVVVPVWSLHRDPAHWPRPHHFMPERFLREARQEHTPYTYLPFGAGPRSCVGVRFAQVVVKAGLAALLSGADVIPSPSSPYPAVLDPRVLTLQPKDGLYISLKPASLPDMLRREMEEHPPLCAEDEAVSAELRRLLASGSGEGLNIDLTD